jgi:lipooligosaccharide transport system permease protein
VWGILAIPGAALCGVAFCAPLMAYSVGLESDMSFPVIIRVVILPLTLFSGVFFPLSALPRWVQVLVQCTPMWHGVALARDACTGTLQFWADLGHVAFLVACTGAGLIWARRAFAKRLTA